MVMNEAIGSMLPMAVGVALSPIPVVAVILMLFTPRARSNSISFLIGWVAGLAVVGTIFLIIGGSATDGDASDSGTAWFKVILGALLVGLSVRNWRQRPHDNEEPETPKWMAAIDDFKAPKSAVTGFVLSGVNPKNLLLTASAAVAISATGATSTEALVTLVIFVLIASVTVGGPTIAYLVAGDRLDPTLQTWKTWLLHNNNVVMAVLLLLIGVKLIGDGFGRF